MTYIHTVDSEWLLHFCSLSMVRLLGEAAESTFTDSEATHGNTETGIHCWEVCFYVY